MFKTIILHLFLALEVPYNLIPFNDGPLGDQTHTVNQDRFNDLLVSHYDCRERLTVRRFGLKRVDDCRTNPHDVANNKARAVLFIRAKATTVAAYQCSLSYIKNN